METVGVINSQLPPGFRFNPTDQEIIDYYLTKKITSTLPPVASIIADVDLYKFDPWDLPEKALFGEGEWFFFSPRDRKYPNGARPNRAAASGYWKATGTDKPILSVRESKCIGVKKALVFYTGKPPKGVKTDWVMNEYRLTGPSPCCPPRNKGSMRLDEWVLCRVRQKGSSQEDQKQEASQFYYQPNSDQFIDKSWIEEASKVYGDIRDEEDDMGSNVDGHVEPLQQVLNTIKRKLSFGAFDELMMLTQSKRSCVIGGGNPSSSPANSFSVDQVFAEFF